MKGPSSALKRNRRGLGWWPLMGRVCKAANARKICSLITDISQRVQFSFVTLTLAICVLPPDAHAAPPYCYCGGFPSFTISSAAIRCFLEIAASFLLTIHVWRWPTVESESSNLCAVLPHRHICKHWRPMLNWAERSVNGRGAAVSYCRF